MVIVASSNDLVSFQLEFMQFLSEPIPQSTDFVVDHWPLASEPVSLFDRSPPLDIVASPRSYMPCQQCSCHRSVHSLRQSFCELGHSVKPIKLS